MVGVELALNLSIFVLLLALAVIALGAFGRLLTRNLTEDERRSRYWRWDPLSVRLTYDPPSVASRCRGNCGDSPLRPCGRHPGRQLAHRCRSERSKDATRKRRRRRGCRTDKTGGGYEPSRLVHLPNSLGR